MRDMNLISDTLRLIQSNGGIVQTVRTEPRGAQFVSGSVTLNGQAVADLVNDGWLVPDGPRDYRAVGETLAPVASL